MHRIAPVALACLALALVAPAAAAPTAADCARRFSQAHGSGPYRVDVRIGGLQGAPSIVEAAEQQRADARLDLLVWLDPPGAHPDGRLHLASSTLPLARERALVRRALDAGEDFDAQACALLERAALEASRAERSRRAMVAMALAALLGFIAVRRRLRRSAQV